MASEAELIREWARARGVPVSDRGRIPGKLRDEWRAARPAAQRDPEPEDDDTEPEDAGIIDIEDDAHSSSSSRGNGSSPPAPPQGQSVGGEPEPDEPPAHAKRDWRRQPKASVKPATIRVTPNLRKDITGQIGFLLQMPGSVWAARDPLCGGAFLQQLPDIADAATDWVVDSPTLLALFAGPAGSLAAKAVKTMIALAPVATTYAAHHVYHSIEWDPDATEATQEQYAA